jgi:hypothetical protein
MVQCLRLALFKGPNSISVSLPSSEEGISSSLRNVVFYSYLELRTMDKQTNPVILSVKIPIEFNT